MITRKIGLAAVAIGCTILACEQDLQSTLDDVPTPVIANFSVEVSSDSIVTFTNKSLGANSYIWDLGDGTISNDENPVHKYTHGFYAVSLKAAAQGDVDEMIQSLDIVTEEIEFVAPPVDSFKIVQSKWELLTGGEGNTKTWVIADEDDALKFGPKDDVTTRWWGLGEGDRTARTCLMDNEFVFGYDSTYVRNTNDAIWKEFNMFATDGCLAADTEEQTQNDTDTEAWKDGSFEFRMAVSGDSTLIQTKGQGAYIAHYVMGVDDSSFEPADEYVYLIKEITEERLEIQAFGFAGDSPIDGFTVDQADRHWEAILVPKSEAAE